MNHQRSAAYRLQEVTEKTGSTERDLLLMAETGEIDLWIWADPPVLTSVGEVSGWLKIPAEFAGCFRDYEGYYIDCFLDRSGQRITPLVNDSIVEGVMYARLPGENIVHHYDDREFVHLVPGEIPVNKNQLRISPEDVEKICGQKESRTRPAITTAIKQEDSIRTKPKIAEELGISARTFDRNYITTGGKYVGVKGADRKTNLIHQDAKGEYFATKEDLDYHKQWLKSPEAAKKR